MKDRKDHNSTPPQQIHTLGTFPWDPMGSYTGRPYAPYEDPVQDADDL